MQCADIFFLKADICQLGMDQRKVIAALPGLLRTLLGHNQIRHPASGERACEGVLRLDQAQEQASHTLAPDVDGPQGRTG